MKTDYNNRGIDDSDVSKDRELVLSSHSLSPSACGRTIYSLDKFMVIIKTHIPGVLFIEPRVFKDSRGYFFESFSQSEFDNKVTPILGHSIHFVQDNESMYSYVAL